MADELSSAARKEIADAIAIVKEDRLWKKFMDKKGDKSDPPKPPANPDAPPAPPAPPDPEGDPSGPPTPPPPTPPKEKPVKQGVWWGDRVTDTDD